MHACMVSDDATGHRKWDAQSETEAVPTTTSGDSCRQRVWLSDSEDCSSLWEQHDYQRQARNKETHDAVRSCVHVQSVCMHACCSGRVVTMVSKISQSNPTRSCCMLITRITVTYKPHAPLLQCTCWLNLLPSWVIEMCRPISCGLRNAK